MIKKKRESEAGPDEFMQTSGTYASPELAELLEVFLREVGSAAELDMSAIESSSGSGPSTATFTPLPA